VVKIPRRLIFCPISHNPMKIVKVALKNVDIQFAFKMRLRYERTFKNETDVRTMLCFFTTTECAIKSGAANISCINVSHVKILESCFIMQFLNIPSMMRHLTLII